MTFLSRIKILPLLIFVAMLSFTVRLGDFITGISHSGTAYAQHEAESSTAEPPPLPAPPAMGEKEETHDAKAEDHGDAAKENEKKKDEHAAAPEASAEQVAKPVKNPDDWKDSSEAEFEYSEVKEDLYKDLAARRKELDKQKKELAIREALLEAAERELDQKLRELTTIRNEIQGLLNRQTEEEKARIQSLVKIYEGMKAKDAANIFNTLDIDVLVTVLTNMSERKAASVLAEMNPERARTVTILLAQQRQLPGSVP